ncbi:MAG: hypothetical protein Q4C71_00555 [Microbacteriaceae bacterium]|nr:hypothetical protein [Microbacteriaceae bacterium]
MSELQSGQRGWALADDEAAGSRVSLSQFYGIEINDFAVTVAETALWISRLKANADTTMLYDIASHDFPLTERPNIVHGNALRLDWASIVPPSARVYMIGNPPFLGHATRNVDQADDLRTVWGRKDIGRLDYVTGWFKKAIDYFAGTPGGRFAFVSTNSIAQGEPVEALFEPIFDAGWRIRFAHQTFAWTTESSGAAAVHCVITGYDKHEKSAPVLFTYPSLKGEATPITAQNINGYLVDAPNVIVKQARKPLSPELPEVAFGNMPRDNGGLVVEAADVEQLRSDPYAAKYLRKYVGAKELVQGLDRWCLWMAGDDFDPKDVPKSPILRERLQAVKDFRAASSAKSTRDMAQTPHLFGQRSHRDVPHIAIPSVVSERRDYFTVEFYTPDVIISNAAFAGEDPDGFAFAIASSSMFITWLKTVGGRLKSDLRFSNTLVWNTLPLPAVDPALRTKIIAAGRAILDARAQHPERSLADHYNPLAMSPTLLRAHAALDKLVDQAFISSSVPATGSHCCPTNDDRLATLFTRYLEMTSS